MSLRPDIVALIAAGRTDAGIAAALGIDRTTANKARHELRWAHEQGVRRAAAARRPPWTPGEQARHCAELLAALRGAA